MRAFVRLLGPLSLLPLAACGGRDSDRQEIITSLRSLGAQASPLVSAPSSPGQAPHTVELTFYAAVPLDRTAHIEPFQDSGSTDGAVRLEPGALTVEAGSDHYEAHNNFWLYSAKAKLTVPPTSAFGPGPFIGGQIRYGLTVSTGDASENVVGNLLVFPAGAAELGWQNPTLTIAAPAAGATVSTGTNVDLDGALNDPVDESRIIGWFASTADVTNRRALVTTWELKSGDAGHQTLVLVAHGSKSRGFAIQAIDVTAD